MRYGYGSFGSFVREFRSVGGVSHGTADFDVLEGEQDTWGCAVVPARMERRAVHEHTQQAWPGFASM